MQVPISYLGFNSWLFPLKKDGEKSGHNHDHHGGHEEAPEGHMVKIPSKHILVQMVENKSVRAALTFGLERKAG